MNTKHYIILNLIIILILAFSSTDTCAQSLINNPCNIPSPSSAEWPLNSACIPVSTTGFSPLFNPGSCNSAGANDGWAWFTGNGGTATVTFSITNTGDAVIHAFSATAPCSVTEVACADATFNGPGVSETMSFATVTGTFYFIRIQNWNSNASITGCLDVATTTPCPPLPAGPELTTNPCSLPVAAEWTTNGVCNTASTCGMTHLFDPTSCGSGVFSDGWAWFPGTGTAVQVDFQPDPGFDATIHVFSDDGTCLVSQLDCSNNTGVAGLESVTIPSITGINYFVRIQQVGTDAAMTGCLSIAQLPPSCDDMIQNGTETGVDCGGSCPTPCATSTCSNTTTSPVAMVTCPILGTSQFDSLANRATFDGSASNSAPSPVPSCGPNWNGSGNFSSWANYDLDPGVTTLSLDMEPLPVSGSDDIFLAYYQGPDCSNLTLVGCELYMGFSVVTGFSLQPVMVQGLNPAQPLWILLFSNSAFSLTAIPRGFASEPGNTSCATSWTNVANGCNAGAVADLSFTPPDAFAAGTCVGGSWLSNENTVYYTFTPTSTNASVQVDNIICNDGTAGTAQFGVWESCADVGTYGAAFLGCAVGSGSLNLSGLTIGQTYVIVVDGNAGDICRWEFLTSGIVILNLNILSFDAEFNGESVDLEWVSKQEYNGDYYVIERSNNSIDFEAITQVPISANNSSLTNTYVAEDNHPSGGINYYRLKFVKTDGTIEYSEIKAVEIILSGNTTVVSPNPLNGNQTGYLYLNSLSGEQITVDIYNTTGMKMSTQTCKVTKGFNKIELNTSKLPSGVFFLSTGNKYSKTNIRFVKK
jgi:hypothetical protein